MLLVSNPLMGFNYNIWNRFVLMALTAKNKVGFVQGIIPRPPVDHLLHGAWIHCKSMVTSWILNFVFKEIADSLLYMDNASNVWNDLRDRFHQSNGPQIFQVKKQLIAFNQGSLDVNGYFTKLKILWDELKEYQPFPICQCGGMK